MKNTTILPSFLLVLNSFLLGLSPKSSNAENKVSKIDSATDSFIFNYNILPKDSFAQVFVPYYASFYNLDSIYNKKHEVKYDIESVGIAVKYISPDGSGFIRNNGSRTWRNMNPGALRNGDFAKQYGSCGKAGGFAVFPTEQHGMEALKGLLKSEKYTNLTIAEAIYKWAPPSDNNDTKAYQRHLSNMTGLNLSIKLCELNQNQIDKVAETIKFLEGWKEGNEEFFEKFGTNKPNNNYILNNQRQYNS